ncbi:DUF4245 domain-containing protein [Parasphingorhabdus pacifica]
MAEQRNQDQPGDETPAAGQPGTEPARPPRTLKAMLFAMLPMVLVAFGIAGLLGQCSFSPLGPTVEKGSAPTVDVGAELRDAAGRVGFPVIEPNLPEGWRANSAGTELLPSGARAVRIGWLTDEPHYLRMSQSTASEEELVEFETERSPKAEGTVRAGDLRWVVYSGVRSEQAWVTEHAGTRVLITGDGSEAEFRTLAEAIVRAPTG